MRRAIQVLAGLAVSGAALWLTLRGKDLHAIWAEMLAADYRYLAPYVVILLGMHLARTIRWGILLEPVADVPFSRLNAVCAVGFMALMILPFRLGEFARPYLIAEPGRLRVSTALSSVVAERVADGIFMGLLLVVTLLGVPDGAPGVAILRTGGVVVSLAFGTVLVFLVVAYRNRALAVRIVAGALRLVSHRLAARAGGMLDAFIHGLRLVPGRRKAGAFVVLTLVYWGLNALGMSVLGRGFGFELGFVESCAVLGVLVVGIMIPAGPGMVGTFQGAIVVALALFAPREAVATRGTAYANVLWLANLAQVTGLGLFFLFSRHIRLGRLVEAPGEVGAELEAEESEYRVEGG
ncbi:MAG TPA: lysylphosphatidylglycerol synthase transmembrane domain-containing protein [Anaeromyxobacter sp.]|nr:lysylphosphatidylglycerol synthase transmembrane domain-containing protein [Anaeromyxobacter sp.]